MDVDNKKFIKILRKLSNDEINFSPLIEIIKKDNIPIKFSILMPRIWGFATYDEINITEYFDDKKKLYFVILHEIAHYKRLRKYSFNEIVLKHEVFFKTKDFDLVINEERIADRYALIVGSYLTNFDFSYYKQDLYEQYDIERYKNMLSMVFKYGDPNYLTHIKKIKEMILWEK